MQAPKTIITPDISFAGYFRGMIQARGVLRFLVGREILSRYRQTTFGLLWAVFQPISMMLILTAVFRNYIPAGAGTVPYSVYVLAGLVAWQLFSRTVESCAISLVLHRNLITKIYIPRVFLPLSQSLAGFIDAACGVVLLLVVLLCHGIIPPAQFVLLPLVLVYCFYCAIGIGLILAVLNVHYRDVQFAVSFLMRLGFFLTPISYPASLIAESWRPLYFLNPLAGALELVRWTVSGEAMDMSGVVISLFVSTAFFVYAIRMFQRMEYKLADIV